MSIFWDHNMNDSSAGIAHVHNIKHINDYKLYIFNNIFRL